METPPPLRTGYPIVQVRLRGAEEELDAAERLILEFHAEHFTIKTPVGADDEVGGYRAKIDFGVCSKGGV